MKTQGDDIGDILQRTEALAGTRERTLAWYQFETLPEFGGKTAESLVTSGRANSVKEFLDHVKLGGFA